MNTTARLRIILAIALGTLTVGCVILFLGMATAVRADSPVDGFLTPGAGDVISFTTSLGILGAETATTHASDQAAVLLTSTVVGKAVITATFGMAINDPGPPSTVTPGASPASIIANGTLTSTIAATISDELSQPVADGTLVTFTTSLGSFPSAPYVRTTEGGMVTATLTSSTRMGTATITISAASAFSNTTVQFIAGDPTTITVLLNPAVVTVGTTRAFTATGQDLYHNPVMITPTWTTNVGPRPMSVMNGLTATAIFTAQTQPAPARGVITATYRGRSGTAIINIVPGTVATLTVSPDPVTVTAGTTRSFTATGQDLYHNAVLITPTWSSNVGSAAGVTQGLTATAIFTAQRSPAPATGIIMATYDNVAGTASVNLVTGAPYTVTLWATQPAVVVGSSSPLKAYVTDRFNNYVANNTLVTFASSLGDPPPPDWTLGGLAASVSHSTVAGTAYITATSVGVTGTTRVNFFPGQPFSITLQANPVTQTVGYSSTLTASVFDQYHNLVTQTVAVSFNGSLRNPVPQVVTTASGRARSWITDTVSGSRFITATSQPSAQPGTTTVTFLPDRPYSMTLKAVPTSQVVGNNSVLTATVYDRYNNTVKNGTPVTFTVSRGSIVSRAATTNGAATSLISDTLAGTRTITATTTGAVAKTTTVTFTPGRLNHVAISPKTVTIAAGQTQTYTVQGFDVYDNSLGDATSSTTFTITPVAGGSWAANIYTSRVAGAWTVTGTNGAVTDTAKLTVNPGVPYTITVQVLPLSQVANSGAVATITATIMDRYDNLLAGQMLTGTLPNTMGTISGLGLTDAAGQAYGLWTAGTDPGQTPLQVTNGSLTGTRQVSLIRGAPSKISVQVNPNVLFANSGMTATVNVTILDAYSNPLPLVAVVGTISPTTLGSVGVFNFTDDNGRASSTWTAESGSVVGAGLLRVSYSDTLLGTADITLTSDPDPNRATCRLQVNPPQLVVNSGATATVTATVIDRYSNLIPSFIVTGSVIPPTLGSLEWLGPTNAQGQAVGIWTAGAVPGSGVLRACNDVITISVVPRYVYMPVLFRNGPPDPKAVMVRFKPDLESTYQTSVTLEVSATIESDTVAWMRFSNDRVTWSDWRAFAPTTTWTLDPNNGLKTVYAQFAGRSGGVSGIVSDQILLFNNGDFSQANLAGWTVDLYSKLPVSTSIDDPNRPGDPAGLLGSPAFTCTGVPTGYASLSQSFVMPDVPAGQQLVLTFYYHVFTFDFNPNLDEHVDRFDVLINGERVLRDMNDDKQKQYRCAPVIDMDGKYVSKPVKGNPGDSIPVVFRLYNEPDLLFNTYVYLDDVHLRFQPMAP